MECNLSVKSLLKNVKSAKSIEKIGYKKELNEFLNSSFRTYYFNSMDIDAFKNFLIQKEQKKVSKMVREKAIENINKKYDNILRDITENEQHYNNVIELVKQLKNCSDVVINERDIEGFVLKFFDVVSGSMRALKIVNQRFTGKNHKKWHQTP